jgi:hypothetical protein
MQIFCGLGYGQHQLDDRRQHKVFRLHGSNKVKRLAVPIAVLAILVTGVIAFANNRENDLPNENPLDGKVVIINPSSISKPRSNARIETLAGKKYIVYAVRPEDGNPYDSWIAVDEVSYLRVFQNKEDADAYLERQKTK